MDVEALYNLAYSLQMNEGKIEQAKEIYKKIILDYPKSREAQKSRQRLEEMKNPIPNNNTMSSGETNINANYITQNQQNSIAQILGFIGKLTIILGIAAGLIVAALGSNSDNLLSSYSSITETRSTMAWVYGITIAVASFVSGAIFIGLGEVINLLHQMNQKLN